MINSSVYVFGCLGKDYTQYPDDYAKSIFKNFQTKATAKSQIIIHRNKDLMYYGYIRKLDIAPKYIGFCVLLNSVILSNIEDLFSIFENAVTDLILRGKILEFTDNGRITSQLRYLSDKQEEVERIAELIRNAIAGLKHVTCELPPVHYGISKDESKYMSVTDDNKAIVETSSKYEYTCILKESGYDTSSLTSYKNILKRLNKEKSELSEKYNILENECNILKRQKKQYNKVIILCIVVIVFGFGLFTINNKWKNTKNDLYEAELSINKKTNTIENLKKENTELQTSLSSEQSKREKTESKLSEYKGYCEKYLPIIIKDVEIANIYDNGDIETDFGNRINSENTMYLTPKITYDGIKSGENITLKIKIYNSQGKLFQGKSSPPDFTYTKTFYVYSGENKEKINGWGRASKGYYPSGIYRFEFWYEDICLKTKTFTIY